MACPWHGRQSLLFVETFFSPTIVYTRYCFFLNQVGRKSVPLMPPPPYFLGWFLVCYSMSEIAGPHGHVLQDPQFEYTGPGPCEPLNRNHHPRGRIGAARVIFGSARSPSKASLCCLRQLQVVEGSYLLVPFSSCPTIHGHMLHGLCDSLCTRAKGP